MAFRFGGDSSESHFKMLHLSREGFVLLGGRNAVYNLSLPDLQENRQQASRPWIWRRFVLCTECFFAIYPFAARTFDRVKLFLLPPPTICNSRVAQVDDT